MRHRSLVTLSQSPGRRKLVEKHLRRHDGDASKRMQDQQVVVSRDEMRRVPLDRQFQKLVVLGVATVVDGLDDFDQHGIVEDSSQESSPLVRPHIAVEFGSHQNSTQFRCGFVRYQQSSHSLTQL